MVGTSHPPTLHFPFYPGAPAFQGCMQTGLPLLSLGWVLTGYLEHQNSREGQGPRRPDASESARQQDAPVFHRLTEVGDARVRPRDRPSHRVNGAVFFLHFFTAQLVPGPGQAGRHWGPGLAGRPRDGAPGGRGHTCGLLKVLVTEALRPPASCAQPGGCSCPPGPEELPSTATMGRRQSAPAVLGDKLMS